MELYKTPYMLAGINMRSNQLGHVIKINETIAAKKILEYKQKVEATCMEDVKND
jgi:hypothetical protein